MNKEYRIKLAKEFGLFLLAVLVLCWLTPKIILSNEDKLAQYDACSKNDGLVTYSNFSKEVLCKDGSKQLWK